MEVPAGLTLLADGDILRYEIGYAAEVGWEAKRQDGSKPPFDFVEKILLKRIDQICHATKADTYRLFLSQGRSFREAISTKRPYKGKRSGKKPWHFDNLTVYMRDVLGAQMSEDGREADDDMAIAHTASDGTTVIASRDKDMKQISGLSYSWELGRQPEWSELVTQEGYVKLSTNHQKLSGAGLAWFYGQTLIGDTVDNISGCPGVGPVRAYELLNDKTPAEQLAAVCGEYQRVYGETWEAEMLEQGRLCWLLRRPGQVWQIGTTE